MTRGVESPSHGKGLDASSTTWNVYTHAVPGGDREAAETLAAILAAHPADRLCGGLVGMSRQVWAGRYEVRWRSE